MNWILNAYKRVRQHRRSLVIGLLMLALLGGYRAVSHMASLDSASRKSPDSLLFEKDSDAWLDKRQNISDFSQALESGNLSAVALTGEAPGLVLYTKKSGEKASVMVPGCTAIGCAGTVLDRLGEKSAAKGFTLARADIDSRTQSQRFLDWLGSLVAPLLTMVTIVAAMVLVTRMQTGMGGAASKMTTRPDLGFDDVIGNVEAKAALNRVKAFLLDPAQYKAIGARAPRGVLLVGPPGTGKTLLAKALAGESKANFIAVDGSYFTAMFYGAGVSKVKDLFK